MWISPRFIHLDIQESIFFCYNISYFTLIFQDSFRTFYNFVIPFITVYFCFHRVLSPFIYRVDLIARILTLLSSNNNPNNEDQLWTNHAQAQRLSTNGDTVHHSLFNIRQKHSSHATGRNEVWRRLRLRWEGERRDREQQQEDGDDNSRETQPTATPNAVIKLLGNLLVEMPSRLDTFFTLADTFRH